MVRQNSSKKHTYVFGAAVAFLTLLCVCLAPFSASAMNEDYLTPQKWAESRNVTSEEIYKTTPMATLEGTFETVTDDENLCLYVHFSVDCTAFDENRDNARITFLVHTENEDYTVSLDKDGPTDTAEGSLKAVATAWNFEMRRSGEFFAAMQYCGKEERCTADVEFYAGSKFVIRENIVLERPVTTKPAKETTTKAPTTASGKKSSNGSGKSSGSARSGSSRASAGEAVTKFVPQGNNYFAETQPDDDVVGETADSAPSQGKTVMSREARVMVLVGIMLAAIGLLIALYAALRRLPPEQTEERDDAAEEPPTDEE